MVTIKKIEIKGFFGKGDFEWNLNPVVNILGGKNGSGKSTIFKACYAMLFDKNQLASMEGSLKKIFKGHLLNDLCPEKELHFNCYLARDFASEIEEKDWLETKFADDKSVSSDNAYLFIRGHELFDHLLNSVLGPMMTALRQQHYKKLQDSDSDSEKRKSCLRAYQARESSIKQQLSHNYRYKGQTDIYDKIAHDVSMIW